MGQRSRLHELFEIAKEKGIVKNQKEFAKLIGVENSSLSHALKNDGRVSLPNTIKKAEHALMMRGVSIEESNVGDGIMQNVSGSNNTVGVPPKNFYHEEEWFALVAEKDRQINRLLSIIEKMQKG